MARQDLTFDQYLHNRFKKTKIDHEKRGRDFRLTFEEYVATLEQSRFATTFRKAFYMYRRTGKLGPHVFGFKTRYMQSQGVCSIHTMDWTTRTQQRKRMGMKKGDQHRPETKVKMSKSQKERFQRPDQIEAMSQVRLGTRHSEETKQKMAAAKLGRKQSAEQCAKRRATWALKRLQSNASAPTEVKIKHADSRPAQSVKQTQKHMKSAAILQEIKAKTHSKDKLPDLDFKIPSGPYEGWTIGELAFPDLQVMFKKKVFERNCPELQVIVNRAMMQWQAMTNNE